MVIAVPVPVAPTAPLVLPIPKISKKVWHLTRRSNWGSEKKFNDGDVTLDFDSINKIVTIGGKIDSVFFTKGKYNYDFRDSSWYFYHPVLKKNILKTEKQFFINSPYSGNLWVWNYDSANLYIVHDRDYNIADEEIYYSFDFR